VRFDIWLARRPARWLCATDRSWFRGDRSLDGSFGSAAADAAACLTARSAVRFGSVPGGLPDSSLDDCPWFRGDGSLDGSFGSVRRRARLFARRLARRFGSAACPATCLTARLTVARGSAATACAASRFGDGLRDGSFGAAAADTAACLTARSAVRFGGVPCGLPDSSLGSSVRRRRLAR
jgi:hypothetical protein